jgi:DNA mismatch endonuclease (patch repair protein)
MADLQVTPERSRLMSKVGGKNTAPEIIVRKVVHSLSYRFRLYRGDLPGSPDLVFPKLRRVIFVHGCFWHRHRHCSKSTTPKTRSGFWRKKFSSNMARDKRNIRALKLLGWKVEVVWECETKDVATLKRRLLKFLGPSKNRK